MLQYLHVGQSVGQSVSAEFCCWKHLSRMHDDYVDSLFKNLSFFYLKNLSGVIHKGRKISAKIAPLPSLSAFVRIGKTSPLPSRTSAPGLNTQHDQLV